MSGVLGRVGRFFGRNGRTFVGKDLEGNSYYELPAVNGGRMKRVVEYKVARDVADYTSGTNRLPVQWTAWLSHTRESPPSLPELQKDYNRRQTLLDKIAEIEARETAERIRQGYLPDPNAPESSTAPKRLSSPSAPSSSSPRAAQEEMSTIGRPGVAGPSRYPTAPSSSASTSPADAPWNASATEAESPPSKVSSPDIAAPRPLVDPSSASSASELRRLAEEDTKRRIAETTSSIPTPDASPASSAASGDGGLKPRRRGAAAS